MHAALNSSIEACLIKRHTRCLLNSHDGICGESVFEMEMAGCWLLGYQSKVGYNWESCKTDIYPSCQLPRMSFVAVFDVTPTIFM